MNESLRKDLEQLRLALSKDGVQLSAPCIGGICHFETRDVGEKEEWSEEGPEWMWRGRPESCMDVYSKRKIDTVDGNRFIVFECIKRCVMSNAPTKPGEPYLNQNSLDHLLECFAHEYLEAML